MLLYIVYSAPYAIDNRNEYVILESSVNSVLSQHRNKFHYPLSGSIPGEYDVVSDQHEEGVACAGSGPTSTWCIANTR
jgi:hypothetical protein